MKSLSAVVIALLLGGTNTAARAAEPVTLNVWTIDQEHSEYHYVLSREFDARHPDITVNVRTVPFGDLINQLARAVASGNAPDVTYVDNPYVAMLAEHDLLLDLTPYVEKSDVIDPQQIFPGSLAAVSWHNRLYAIPRGANTLALYYNADAFRTAGLDPDQPPRTWQALYRDAGKLDDPAQNRYGIALAAPANEQGTFQFLPWAQMAGAHWNDIDAPGAVRALKFWNKLLDEKLTSPETLIRDQATATRTFNAGNAAMVISGPWELPRMAKEADFDYRAALLPTPTPDSPGVSALGEGVNAILASTDHPGQAFELLEYYYSQMPRDWNEFGMLPASRVAVDQPKWPAIYRVFDNQMQYARTRGPTPAWPQVSKAIQDALQQALSGQMKVQPALVRAQQKIDQATEQ